jgi:acyl-CoA synthetase (AMP-forming)/AMP-acid ligase II
VDEGAAAATAMFACWLAGGVFVPVNARLSDAEVRAHLDAAAPAVVVVGSAHAGRVPPDFDRLVERSPDAWERLAASTPRRPAGLLPEGAAIVMRTSGTTGASKPVVLRHEGVREGIDTVIASLRGGGKGRDGGRPPMPNLIPTSLALWAGIWNTLFAFRLGASAILLDRFDPVEYAGLVKRFGIRSSILAPAMMTMLTEDPRVTDLAPLKLVRSVTAPLTPVQARRFRDRFGVAILNSYGQTELGGEVAGWTAADVREHGDTKLGAVGRPHSGVTIQIVGEDSRELPRGATGEIWIRSSFGTGEGQIDADRLAGGFLRTGDLGSLDADGFLWIEGRTSDMINRGGFKIVPAEVEEVLRRHPGVADACVAGVPDPRLGEAPVAWIRPAAGERPEAADLLAFARASLAGYKVPVDVRFTGDFPRTEIGKVRRRELAEGYQGPPPGGGPATGHAPTEERITQ